MNMDKNKTCRGTTSSRYEKKKRNVYIFMIRSRVQRHIKLFFSSQIIFLKKKLP